MMGSLDCNEYENLKSRGFRDYSLGHRIMYEVPIRLMTGKRWKIVEAGFGIGWGLDRMLEASVVESYLGYEPNKDAFGYVAHRHGGTERVTLRHGPFEESKGADHVFCIEVIEHVPMEAHADFLMSLRRSGKTLWMSTPDSSRSSEGVRTPENWKHLLTSNGFTDVTVHTEQWTVLFVAQ